MLIPLPTPTLDFTLCRLHLEGASSLGYTNSWSTSTAHHSELELPDVAEICESQQTGEAAARFPTTGICSMGRVRQ